MIITLGGKAGSWKWTVAKLLSEKLGYEIISIWNLKRKLAEEMGLSISEFNLLGEKPENQHEFDLKYEEYQKNLDLNSQVILESRLWFLCQPNAFKVFLNVSDEVASQRILNDKRTTDQFFSPEEALEVTKKRNQDDQNRYLSLYNIDLWNSTQPKHWHFKSHSRRSCRENPDRVQFLSWEKQQLKSYINITEN